MQADRQRSRNLTTRPARWVVAAAALALASGCSVLEEDKVDYRSAKQGNSLEVPPDLSQLARDNRYAVPGSTVTASGYQTAQPTRTTTTAANQVADTRIERSGNQRWLVVDRPPEQLWTAIRDFWQENGFLLVLDQQGLGILETDWAENRAKLPQDFIRNTLGRVFENLYSTGERDKFRTRLERNAAGGTEIFISHRGMIEVYSTTQKDATVWQPRPADPELETEFLRRLMVKLGVSQEVAQAQAARPAQPLTTRIADVNGPTLLVNEDFDRAWRRVGLALDRTGFTVEDRDRSQGIYFVRYVPPDAPKGKEPGFFGRLFSFGSSNTTNPEPLRYRVQVRESGGNTSVKVLNAAGQPDTSANGPRILQVLAADMK